MRERAVPRRPPNRQGLQERRYDAEFQRVRYRSPLRQIVLRLAKEDEGAGRTLLSHIGHGQGPQEVEERLEFHAVPVR